MAIAYRHMGLGSPLQVMHFVRQRMDELTRTISDWENEYEMWAKVDSRPGDGVPAAARAHLHARQHQLSGVMASAKHELGTLEKLYTAFLPCTECGGSGEYRVQHDQDDIRSYPCKSCKGSATRA